LTEYEQTEVDICSKFFQQLEDNDDEICEEIASDNELPNFALGFDFLFGQLHSLSCIPGNFIPQLFEA